MASVRVFIGNLPSGPSGPSAAALQKALLKAFGNITAAHGAAFWDICADRPYGFVSVSAASAPVLAASPLWVFLGEAGYHPVFLERALEQPEGLEADPGPGYRCGPCVEEDEARSLLVSGLTPETTAKEVLDAVRKAGYGWPIVDILKGPYDHGFIRLPNEEAAAYLLALRIPWHGRTLQVERALPGTGRTRSLDGAALEALRCDACGSLGHFARSCPRMRGVPRTLATCALNWVMGGVPVQIPPRGLGPTRGSRARTTRPPPRCFGPARGLRRRTPRSPPRCIRSTRGAPMTRPASRPASRPRRPCANR